MNNVAYFEIQASDPERAIQFYSIIFGWHFFKEEHAPVDYWQIQTNGINGGLLKRPAPAPSKELGTNAFTCSIEVEDFDVMSEKILNKGGIVALEKFAIPGKCWQGYFIDTEGNTFGLFQVDKNAGK
jgi:uncharacterized protein